MTRPIAALLCVSLALGPAAARADNSNLIRCESRNHRYQYCKVETGNRVLLARQISRADCVQGDSWGYDRRGVWVDRGCTGEFRVGRDSRDGDHDKNDGKKAALIGAAVVGAVLLAALVADRNSPDEAEQAPAAPWAGGSYSAYDELERIDLRLTIGADGAVSGLANGAQFSGSFTDPVLQTGRFRFKVERTNDGFVAVDEADPNHRVSFRRTVAGDSGY